MAWSWTALRAASYVTMYKILNITWSIIVWTSLILLMTIFGIYVFVCVFTVGLMTLPFKLCSQSIRDRADQLYESILELPISAVETLGSKISARWRLRARFRSKYHEYQSEREALRLEPAPLPRKRKRRLSVGKTAAQLESPFIQKLPPEIRRMIYKYVIIGGSSHRHIVEVRSKADDGKQQRNHLWGAGCFEGPGLECKGLETHGVLISSQMPECSLRPSYHADGELNLAKTCRQIYLETIDMFYGSLIHEA